MTYTIRINSKVLWIVGAVIALTLFFLPRFVQKLQANTICYNPYQNNPYQNNPPVNNVPTNSQTTVTIGDDFYSPRSISVAAGTTVTWVNNGTMMHTVTADDGSFDSGTLMPGQSFFHTFSTQAIVPYHCRFHGAAGGIGMSGTVNVGGVSNNNPYNYNTNTGQTNSNTQTTSPWEITGGTSNQPGVTVGVGFGCQVTATHQCLY